MTQTATSADLRTRQDRNISSAIVTPADQSPSKELTFDNGVIKFYGFQKHIDRDFNVAIEAFVKDRANVLSSSNIYTSIGGLITMILLNLTAVCFLLFGVSLYNSIFITPKFSLFLAMCFGSLAFETVYSRRLMKGTRSNERNS